VIFVTAAFAGLPTVANVFIWIGIALAVSGLLMIPLSFIVASYFVYTLTLRRKTPDQWDGDPAKLKDDYLSMDKEKMEWFDSHSYAKKDVHIVRNGLNLYGEYFDFGNKKCMIFMSGRTENHRYGYYFAKPYGESGYNVLVVDPRAHGKSDGEFNTVGFEESGDILEWARFIHDSFGVEHIIFHGICIGAAGAVFALTSKDCPEYIRGMIAEGMYPNFGESMKNHLIERKKPVKGLYPLINAWMKHYTGYSMNVGPIDVIGELKTPILMLHSKEDLYSTPEYAEKLFDKIPHENKTLVWFETGRHSMLRPTHTEKYDGAIKKFIFETENALV